MRKLIYFPFAILLLFSGVLLPNRGNVALAQEAETSTPEEATPEPDPVTPADLLVAVNTLRMANGLYALNAHPVLMQVAQTEANGIANGMPGHWRPSGLTLGQWLLSLGYPLSGDLSQDGYRSENWFYMSTSTTVDEIITSWQGDAEHRETMFSVFRSDIGAGIAITPDGEVVAVLETALQTKSGVMQYGASAILTGIVQTQSAYSVMGTLAAENGTLPQYSIPVHISTARPDGDVIHEVAYGQTLWSIAIQYNTTIAELKRLNGLADDTVVPGWTLLIQKGATQPAPMTDVPSSLNPTQTSYPTSIPYYTSTPSPTATVPSIPMGQVIKQNSTVVASLLIAFSVLLAGIIGFGKKKEE